MWNHLSISETSSPVTDGESNISFFGNGQLIILLRKEILFLQIQNLQLPNLKQSIQVRRVVVSDYNSISCSKTSNIISINVVQSSEPQVLFLKI